MKTYNLVPTDGIRAIGTSNPRTERERNFVRLWSQKQHSEALKFFPDKWSWYGEDVPNEAITDIPGIIFTGIIFSEKAFNIIYPVFKDDLMYQHPLAIDGHQFIWSSIPVISHDDAATTKHHLYMFRPLYNTCVSEVFMNFCKENNFTGRNFVPVDISKT